MRAFAGFIMRGRIQAVLAAAVSTILSALLAPLSYVGAGAIALVALRHGAREGLLVMAGAGAVAALLAQLVLGTALAALVFAVILWLPVWLLSLLLRQTGSQGLVLAGAGLLGLLGILAVHLLVGSPAAWWKELLEQTLVPILAQRGVVVDEPTLISAAQLMTGLVIALTLLGILISLYLGRWWQSLLYNPGGFGREFRELRLGRRMALATAVLVVAALLAGKVAGSLGVELLILAVTIYMIQGLAVAHALVASRGASVGWLVGLYFLVLFASPHAMLAVGIAGYADSWLDFRKRFGPQ